MKRAAVDAARAEHRRRRALMVDHTREDAAVLEEREAAATERVLGVMAWGMAAGPLFGGALCSDPRGSGHGTAGGHPFLGPNLLAAGLCLLSAASVAAAVRDRPAEKDEGDGTATEITSLVPTDGGEKAPGRDHSGQVETLGTVRVIAGYLWKARSTRSHLVAYAFFSFCVVLIEEALPLFLIARHGGLGLSEARVGAVLAAGSVVSASLQRLALDKPFMDDVYGALHLSGLLGAAPCALVPVSVWLAGGTYASRHGGDGDEGPDGGLPASSFAFLAVLFGLLRFFASVYFVQIGLATHRTVPATLKDGVSRFMTMLALAARSAAPIVAGLMATVYDGRTASADAWPLWLSVAAFGLASAAKTWSLRDAADARPDWRRPSRARDGGGSGGSSSSSSDLLERRRSYLSHRQRARAYMYLWELHYDKHSSSTAASKWRHAVRKAIALNRIAGGSAARYTPWGRAAELESALKADGSDIDDGDASQPSREVSWESMSSSVSTRRLSTGEVPFFILGTHKDDESVLPHVLTPPLMEALHRSLPASASEGHNFYIKYSLVRDGSNLKVLQDKAYPSRNTILAIETLEGDVIGSFTSRPWTRSSGYRWDGQSFLWRMRGRRSRSGGDLTGDAGAAAERDIEVFRYSGENDLCQLLTSDKLAVGGDGDGFGLVVDEDLYRGGTGPCVTYGSPALVEGGAFEVANLEVWSMTPFLFVSEAERSEESLRYREENTCPSSSSPWSQFL